METLTHSRCRVRSQETEGAWGRSLANKVFSAALCCEEVQSNTGLRERFAASDTYILMEEGLRAVTVLYASTGPGACRRPPSPPRRRTKAKKKCKKGRELHGKSSAQFVPRGFLSQFSPPPQTNTVRQTRGTLAPGRDSLRDDGDEPASPRLSPSPLLASPRLSSPLVPAFPLLSVCSALCPCAFDTPRSLRLRRHNRGRKHGGRSF